MSKKWFVPFIIGTFLSTCFSFNTKIIQEDKEHSESNINFSELKKVEKKKTARVNFSELPVPNYVIAPDFGGDWIDCEDVAFHQNRYFDIKSYFQNLYTYSPANDVGSCGYVSLIQAMSYYDTFYNDTIIPEMYDKHKLDATSIDDVKLYSPGTLWQHYDSSTYGTYYNFCHSTQWTNFQSYLTVLFNYNNSTDNPYDFDPSLAGWQYGELFNYLYGFLVEYIRPNILMKLRMNTSKTSSQSLTAEIPPSFILKDTINHQELILTIRLLHMIMMKTIFMQILVMARVQPILN